MDITSDLKNYKIINICIFKNVKKSAKDSFFLRFKSVNDFRKDQKMDIFPNL